MSLLSEFVIQVPTFVIGMYALWYRTSPTDTDDRRIYPILAVYGALGTRFPNTASFTTLQCIAMVVWGEERAQLTSANLAFILQYVWVLTKKLYPLYADPRGDHGRYGGTDRVPIAACMP